jgi:hypothetical protein
MNCWKLERDAQGVAVRLWWRVLETSWSRPDLVAYEKCPRCGSVRLHALQICFDCWWQA